MGFDMRVTLLTTLEQQQDQKLAMLMSCPHMDSCCEQVC